MTGHRVSDCVRRTTGAALVAGVCALTTIVTPVAKARPAQTPPAPTVVAKADLGWPRDYTTATGARVRVHQPQVASWEGQKHMTALAAVSYTPVDAEQPTLGTIKLEANTSVAVAERMVRFASLAITEMNFPSLSKEQSGDLAAELTNAIPKEDRVITLDRVLTSIDKSSLTPKETPGLKADPPTVYFSKTPAVLVGIDGNPIWSPVKDNDLKFAVNTNWDLFLLETTKTYYLRNGDTWLTAQDVAGPWTPAGALPESFANLPDDENWKDVKANLPGKATHAKEAVFVSSDPTELIVTDGEPWYQPVPGTSLMWVSNTDSDLFRVGKTGMVYFLVSGRWFSAPDFTGPWTFASTSLPEDFTRIPRSHPLGRVLASVPGTDAAKEAIVLAQIPRTAMVDKRELKAPPVTYQGEPQFDAIDGTTAARAANTDKDIIKVGDLYYMCYQAVWFVGSSPEGPWEVTSSVPGEIYEIPTSSPSHHVTYVTVEEDDDTSDDWVTFGYYAGYTGLMVGWGCAVWGTGWYYPPYVWWGGGYPVYYPYMRTYGYGAWYNPWTGSYGSSIRAYGPYGGAAFGARYNPYTGGYARGAAAWGPYGARGVAEAWNPRTGTYAATRQGANMYGSWGSTAVQRGDDWMKTGRVTNRATGTTTRATRTDSGGAVSRRGPEGGGFVGKGNDNVYAGHDGNVYRKNEGGNWQKWDNGGWNSVERPSGDRAETMRAEGTARRPDQGTVRRNDLRMDSSTYQQLERERSGRYDASNRSRDFNNYQRNRSSYSGSRGSYGGYGGSRGGMRGGGMRGGGGRRGR